MATNLPQNKWMTDMLDQKTKARESVDEIFKPCQYFDTPTSTEEEAIARYEKYQNEEVGQAAPPTNLDPNSRYYDQGGIEVLKIIEAKLTREQYQGFLLGNILKYASRANWKGSFERDVTKIGFYQSFLDKHQKETA